VAGADLTNGDAALHAVVESHQYSCEVFTRDRNA
jgi:hypothetical protein